MHATGKAARLAIDYLNWKATIRAPMFGDTVLGNAFAYALHAQEIGAARCSSNRDRVSQAQN